MPCQLLIKYVQFLSKKKKMFSFIFPHILIGSSSPFLGILHWIQELLITKDKKINFKTHVVIYKNKIKSKTWNYKFYIVTKVSSHFKKFAKRDAIFIFVSSHFLDSWKWWIYSPDTFGPNIRSSENILYLFIIFIIYIILNY